MADYEKAGLLVVREGRILLCRKSHSTSKLILPGGCLEPGESATQCLAREIREGRGHHQTFSSQNVMPELATVAADLADTS